MLEYCKKNIDTRLLLTSTFEVYGKIDGIDVYSENMVGLVDFHMLRNGYTESKRCAEMLVNSYIDEYGINAVICRLASIYGPTMLLNDSKAHAQFIRNALHGENIALKSKGNKEEHIVMFSMLFLLCLWCFPKERLEKRIILQMKIQLLQLLMLLHVVQR